MAGKKREAKFIISADNKTAGAFAKITGDLKSLGSQFSTFQKFAGGAIGALAGSAAIRGITNMVQRANDLTDSLRDSSIRLGIGMSDLQAYQLAAKNAGIEVEQLEGLIGKMTKAVGDAKLGQASDKQLAAFERVGLSFEDLQKATPATAFEQVIDGLGQIGDHAQRSATAMEIFGKQGRAALTLVADGTDSLREAKELIAGLGLALDEVDGAKVDAANDALGTMGALADAAVQKFSAELSPAILAVANMLQKASTDGTNLGQTMVNAADTTVAVIDRIISGARVVGNAFEITGNLVHAGFLVITGVAAEFIALLIDGIGTSIPLTFKQLLEAGEDTITALKQGFNDFGVAVVNSVVGAINMAIEALDKLVNEAAKGISGLLDQVSKIPGVGKVSFSYSQQSEKLPLLPQKAVERVDLLSSEIEPFGLDAAAALRGYSRAAEEGMHEQIGDLNRDVVDLQDSWKDLWSEDGGALAQGFKEASDYARQLTGEIDPESVSGGAGGKGKGGATGAMKKLKEGSKSTGKAIKETFSILDEYGKIVTNSLEKAIDDFTKDGKLNMAEFARSVLSDLAAITAKAAILGGILGNSQYGGNGSGLVGAALSGILSGATSTAGASVAIPVSYDGGGFTGFGSRSGGVDGRGGFAAILHPNESVIDHTKGDSAPGGPITVQQTVIVRETMPAGVTRAIVDAATKQATAALKSISDRGGKRRKSYGFA